ncbi:MAG TPA: AtpZ/AtpI family protein, partial [Desulfobacteraceae bacterium]|nr:AtpZ/AtpI family protein [Desulfobacteraceae bacterium]
MSSKKAQDQQNNKQSQQKKSPKKSDDLKSYARYSSIAFQMIIIIGLMTYAGVKLDERRGGETFVYTVILSLLGVFAALYTS